MTADAGNTRRLAEHGQLVQALLGDVAALPEPPATRALLQTHISSLIVAGDRVYKLRKPLRLDFLDFATPARRRADCEEELRLNRRTAPTLYLEVLPITGRATTPRLGRDAEAAIDWVLVMRRFDDTLRLDRLAERGALGAAQVDALAAEVARFHAALPPSPGGFGDAQTVRHWALENFDALLAGPAAAACGERLRALRGWTEAEFARRHALIERRRAEGCVREGHGDLHLGNIVLHEGRPLLFDCLEFNPSLRHGDVVADLAFLFMDLRRHGLARLAWRLVDIYCEHTGDYGGLALLRFFAVYRAMVRAKVALLRAAQHGDHDANAWAAFERDLALAERLAAAPAAPPRLFMTCGVSGSGKTTVARLLADATDAVRVRSDVERKRLHGMAGTERPDAATKAALYGPAANERTYARLAEVAADLLDAGIDTVVDAALLRRAERDRLRAVAAARGARAVLVECVAPPAVLRERVRERLATDRDASDADLAVLEVQRHRLEPVAADEAACRLDTDIALPALRERVLHCLDGGARL